MTVRQANPIGLSCRGGLAGNFVDKFPGIAHASARVIPFSAQKSYRRYAIVFAAVADELEVGRRAEGRQQCLDFTDF